MLRSKWKKWLPHPVQPGGGHGEEVDGDGADCGLLLLMKRIVWIKQSVRMQRDARIKKDMRMRQILRMDRI